MTKSSGKVGSGTSAGKSPVMKNSAGNTGVKSQLRYGPSGHSTSSRGKSSEDEEVKRSASRLKENAYRPSAQKLTAVRSKGAINNAPSGSFQEAAHKIASSGRSYRGESNQINSYRENLKSYLKEANENSNANPSYGISAKKKAKKLSEY